MCINEVKRFLSFVSMRPKCFGLLSPSPSSPAVDAVPVEAMWLVMRLGREETVKHTHAHKEGAVGGCCLVSPPHPLDSSLASLLFPLLLLSHSHLHKMVQAAGNPGPLCLEQGSLAVVEILVFYAIYINI